MFFMYMQHAIGGWLLLKKTEIFKPYPIKKIETLYKEVISNKLDFFYASLQNTNLPPETEHFPPQKKNLIGDEEK